ncbi:MlrC-like protein [Paraburkholderia piptadeniae]|uniref:Microcystinase C n=1 Tax=Paraburkholderia piptadeniae TaxID=1701573 RepID=A0A1N7SUJ5_9BURK|nr:M81 family metallopeptidase [Paraburkholderia piptadeniae]SIT51013.1 MlrC-like protein [Paraburkholderia piptadeniae]
MARIAIAGFLHETNTFASTRARFRTFVEPDAWPGLLVGREMLEAVADVNLAIEGFIDAARSAHELVPLLWASANPSGMVTEDAFEAISFMLGRMIRDAGPIDGLFLDLHGSMVAEHVDDGEGELLRRLRELVGLKLPIVAALDFHANVSPAMVEHASGLVSCRTFPHVDMAQTGRRALRLMNLLLAGLELAKGYRQLPFLIPVPWQSTLTEPMCKLSTLGATMESVELVSADFLPGLPLTDTYDCGPSVIAYGTDRRAVEAVVNRLSDAVLKERSSFCGHLYTPDEAVEFAMRHAALPAAGAVILADTQDNPGGGGNGDTTDILRELIRRGARRVCAGVLCDAEFARLAMEAGVGAFLDAPLGAADSTTGAQPLQAPFEVLALGSGSFAGTGPFYRGCRMDLGPMTRVRCGGPDGIEIVVSTRKQQAGDRAMFRHVGADPAEYRILVLKSTVQFRADFASLADAILVVTASGPNIADLRQLHYKKLRSGVEVL